MTNIIIDFFIGLIPFAGDLADALYKCNTRNAVLLEKYLRERGAAQFAGQGAPAGEAIDMSLGEEFDRGEHGVITNSDPENGTMTGPGGAGDGNGASGGKQ